MTTTRSRIISAAGHVFDRHGFAGTGIDRLTESAGVSTRTLYKHLGSKSGLVVAVLDERRARFVDRFDVDTVDELFDTLEAWTQTEGARGCLFLRAQSEDGEGTLGVSSTVTAYREQLHDLVRRVVTHETGHDDDVLAEQVLVLFEGATSAASYRGTAAIHAAKAAASALVNQAQ
ncbi:TetR/AcrR family transcriptional regulator [Aeromicrobium sp. CF3.5]|uniref:TetR/AcrR family transcriptional regulator n=1 Tax=Aeromicrobium sp. CF3.5 TaxID=3373078 RepID=UPI003EE45301